MRNAILITCLSAAALATVAGCSRTIVRETVVEKPVVQRETIVQAPATCTLAGTAFSGGSMSCQGGLEYQCTDGAWQRTGRAC